MNRNFAIGTFSAGILINFVIVYFIGFKFYIYVRIMHMILCKGTLLLLHINFLIIATYLILFYKQLTFATNKYLIVMLMRL